MLALPVPAYAAWGVTDTISLQAYGTSGYGVVTDVGSVTGWVQFDSGGNTIQYSLTICRQSGYVWPHLNIGVDAIYSPQGQWTDTPLANIDMPSGTAIGGPMKLLRPIATKPRASALRPRLSPFQNSHCDIP